MASVEKKLMRRRMLGAYLSSVFSIAMVLLLVGVAALLMVNARNASEYFKESMKVEVVFKLDTPEKDAKAYAEALRNEPFCKSAEFITKEQGIQEMKQTLGDDFLKVFEIPPVPYSVDMTLYSAYVVEPVLDSLLTSLAAGDAVEDVVCQRSVVDAMNRNMNRISVILAVVIVLLVFISYVLIGNMVRLSLHNKRFTIHTMRLVGATRAFIARPFVARSVAQGVVASLLSMIFLLAVLFVVKNQFVQMLTIFPKRELYAVMGVMLASGVMICLLSTAVVVARMVTLSKEELYV